MPEKYTSEHILREIQRPLINFLWYLWDIYYDPCEKECRITLQDGGVCGQRFIIYSSGEIITQDFGSYIDADIAIRKYNEMIFMEYY